MQRQRGRGAAGEGLSLARADILYFAYGSNMLTARLAARCPSARLMGVAWADGHAVRFEKHGMDGSGKAALVAAVGAAPGVLYALDRADLAALDRFEGAGRGYDRDDAFAIRHDGRDLAAVTYRASHPRPGLSAFDWYLALVLAGAHQHGFDDAYMTALRTNRWHADPHRDRPGRLAALSALTAHGHAAPETLLQPPLRNGVQSASASISSPIASRS